MKKNTLVLWGTKKGAPAWQEEVIVETSDKKHFNKALAWAKKNNFVNLRTMKLDTNEKPDFIKTIKTNPVRDSVPHLKKSYVLTVVRYLQTGKEELGQAAALLQNQLQAKMSKEAYLDFMRQGSRAFHGVKIKSKALQTLLKTLDNEIEKRYTLRDDKQIKKNPAFKKKAGDNWDEIDTLFKRFHHYPADKIKYVDVEFPAVVDGKMKLMKLGTMPEIVYISDKDIDDKGIRIKTPYIHKFRKHLDILTDGKMLIIPLDGQAIEARGMIYKKERRLTK